jgi:cell division protein FtsB
LVAVWLGTLVVSLVQKAEIAWQAAEETKAEYASLSARKAALTASLDTLSTPRGQDAAIRQSFGVARPGEEVIIVVPPATTTEAPPPPTWWQKILGWF